MSEETPASIGLRIAAKYMAGGQGIRLARDITDALSASLEAAKAENEEARKTIKQMSEYNITLNKEVEMYNCRDNEFQKQVSAAKAREAAVWEEAAKVVDATIKKYVAVHSVSKPEFDGTLRALAATFRSHAKPSEVEG